MKLTTFLTKDYFISLQTLAYSLYEYGNVSGLDWHLIWGSEPHPAYDKILGKFGFNVINHTIDSFKSKVPDIVGTNINLMIAKNKLLAFLLPEGRYTYIDCDMVCKRDARGLLDFKPFSAMRRPGKNDF